MKLGPRLKTLAALTALTLILAGCPHVEYNWHQPSDSPWSGTLQWGSPGASTIGYSIATSIYADNIYLAGVTDGDFYFGHSDLSGTEHAFSLWDAQEVTWRVFPIGVPGGITRALSVATDATSNAYMAGYTNGDLDGNTLTGTVDFFLAKFDDRLRKQFTYQLGVSGGSTYGNSVATDAVGNVYVAGETDGGLDGNTLTGTSDFFVTRFDSDGVKQYTRQLGAAGASTRGESVATDAAGNVYVAGITNGNLDGNTLTGTDDFFVTKFDGNGIKQFTRQFGVAGSYAKVHGIATDTAGNVYLAGETGGGLDGNTLTGTSDFFVTKLDGNGNREFTRQFGVAGQHTGGLSVATDREGNIYVAGGTDGGLDGEPLTGTTDAFVTKFDNAGNKLFTRLLGDAGAATICYSIATDANNNFFIAGSTTGNLDGHGLMGTKDLFVAKYDSNGVKQ